MKSDGLMEWLSRLICAVCVLATPGMAVVQAAEYFVPASGKGPAVVLASGARVMDRKNSWGTGFPERACASALMPRSA